jgi:hypothetical protein
MISSMHDISVRFGKLSRISVSWLTNVAAKIGRSAFLQSAKSAFPFKCSLRWSDYIAYNGKLKILLKLML